MHRLDGLNLRHLQALAAVSEHGTFGRAAGALGFTQSAVSQQIATLERVVGEPVFDRPGGPRPVRLTPVGRLLLRHAQQILDRVELLDRDLEGHRRGDVGRIEVGIFQSAAVKVLPEVVGRLRREVPLVDVRPHEGDDDQAHLDCVLDGELDVAFLAGAVVDHGVRVVPLCVDPYVAVLPADRTEEVVRLESLAADQLVGQPEDGSCQIRIEAALREVGVNPDYVFRTGDNAALQSMVRAGMGVAVMPLLAVDAHDPSIAVRPTEPAIPHREIALAVRHGAPAVVERFVEIALEVCQGENSGETGR